MKVEGWQSIAAAYGCAAGATRVERTEDGVQAIGELRRISDGALLATAVGFVGKDEPTWYGGEVTTKWGKKTLPKRPDFAIQAMAQTRAISRVCRSAFAFVVVLIDGNLSTTPAEEMMGVHGMAEVVDAEDEALKAVETDWSAELKKAKSAEELRAGWERVPSKQKTEALIAEKDLLKMQFTKGNEST